jgi:23S rRNA pseudouridine2605 synthase
VPDADDGRPARIQKFLALCGAASRRGAEPLIAAGRVRINGVVVTNPATPVGPGDLVELDGVPVGPREHRYVLLHKPLGTVCTRFDPQRRRTIYELLPPDWGHLAYVGRLDINTDGVLLLTNDGTLTYRLTRPEFEVERDYEATVRGKVRPEVLAPLLQGIRDEGELMVARSACIVSTTPYSTIVAVKLTEGKNREVRRMLEALGLVVVRLTRVRFAGIEVGDLAPGDFRELAPEEVEMLRRACQPVACPSRPPHSRGP